MLETQKEIQRVYLEWGKSVWGYVKGWELHVTEKAVQLFREEHCPCQRLVTQALSQHHSTVQSHLCTLVSAQVNTCQVWVKQISSIMNHCMPIKKKANYTTQIKSTFKAVKQNINNQTYQLFISGTFCNNVLKLKQEKSITKTAFDPLTAASVDYNAVQQ